MNFIGVAILVIGLAHYQVHPLAITVCAVIGLLAAAHKGE